MKNGEEMMALFAEFGALRDNPPESDAVQAQVKKLQDYITKNHYECTLPILAGLGAMYSAGGELTDNIDLAGGAGTAEFVSRAIEIFYERAARLRK